MWRVLLLLACLAPAGCRSKMLHMREEGPGGPGTFRVAALHLRSYNGSRATPEAARRTLGINFLRQEILIRLAAAAGARMVVTPEYGTIGRYLMPGNRCNVCTRLPAAPTTEPFDRIDDPGIAEYMRDYARLSRELGIYILTQTIEQAEAGGRTTYFNAFVAFDPQGRLVANYRKINLWMFEHLLESSGDETVAFDTPYGRFGLLNCFDAVLPLTWTRCVNGQDVDFLATTSLWQHVPITGWMAMKSLAVLSGRPVVWSNQARLGLGGGAGILRPRGHDTSFGIWGPEGVVVANLPLPERLRPGAAARLVTAAAAGR